MRGSIHLIPVGLLLAVACIAAPSDPSPPPPPPPASLPRITAVALPDLPRREGEVGTTLPRPIRVEVRLNGVPVGGARVTWGPGGSLSDVVTQTDGSGIASARWTLGPEAGIQHAWATVEAVSGVVDFEALALGGPPVSLEKAWGDGQRIGAAAVYGIERLGARAVDRFGNLAPSAIFRWSVESGPVELEDRPIVVSRGMGAVELRGTGQSGMARVVVTVDGLPLQATYSLELAADEWGVGLVNTSYTAVGFRSYQNLSLPAVDTLPVGASLAWKFRDSWDVVQPPYAFGSANPLQPMPPCEPGQWEDEICRVTFTTPGTYTYTISGQAIGHGTVVVQ